LKQAAGNLLKAFFNVLFKFKIKFFNDKLRPAFGCKE
jgi:hypothetical protein